jgi:transposase InsO family protein
MVVVVHLRNGADGVTKAGVSFLRRLCATASTRTEVPLGDNGGRLTDRFISKTRVPTGKRAFDHMCALLGAEHRLVKPCHPQTDGMVERFNGRISNIPVTTRFRSRGDMETTTKRCEKLCNKHLLQQALGHQTPLRAIRARREKRPEPFIGKPKNQMTPDSCKQLDRRECGQS